MLEKRCTNCLEMRPLSAFHKVTRAKDGLARWCRPCNKIRNGWASVKDKRKVMEYGKIWRREYRKNNLAKVREYEKKKAARRRAANGRTEKERVWKKVETAVKAGKLLKPDSCSQCGNAEGRIHAHHDDYSKPMEVVWVCQPCHGKLHRRLTS